ncbi:MAG: hypothetical protein K6F81_06180 [Acholeplasmatales bacterium]|nr:hypothetical protein [Acholeplasmatales bacterium]
MNELVVKKNKIDKSLANIDKMAKENKKLHEFERFQEKTGLIKHNAKVTGAEMNEFAEQVQKNFINLNNKINMYYKQFTEIHNVFESLDTNIVAAFNKAVEATNKAEDAQKDIDNIADRLEKTVEKIKEFKNKVSHELSLIDSDNWRENALKHQKELNDLDNKAEEIGALIYSYKSQHKELVSQLNMYKKEKKRSTISFRICWITSAISVLTLIVLIILIIFGVL